MQYPSYANPPTLTMAVTAFIERLKNYKSGPSNADLGLGFDTQIVLEESDTSSTGDLYLKNPELALEFLRSI